MARIGLGTINHTCLTVACARARGLRVLGVVCTRTEDPRKREPGPDEARNPQAVAGLGAVEVLGNIPFIPERDPERARAYVDAAAILSGL